MFSLIGNPPTGQGSTVRYGTLQSLPSGASVVTPPNLAIFWYDAELPSSVQWNTGVQMALPWSSSLDVSYVGVHGYNVMAQAVVGTTLAANTLDINAPDLGAAFLSQNQDPTVAASTIPGASALSTDFLRPYRGLGAIFTSWPRALDAVRFDSNVVQPQVPRRLAGGSELDLEPAHRREHELTVAPAARCRRHADRLVRPERRRQAAQEYRESAARHQGEFRVAVAWCHMDQRCQPGARARAERLAAFRCAHRRVDGAVRPHILVYHGRREREPHRLSQLPGAHACRW